MIETLTTVSEADLKQIMAIWLAGNLEAHAFVSETYWRANVAAVAKSLPQAELTVAKVDDKIVGFAGMQADYLAGLFVAKQYRNHGIGRQLLQALQLRHPTMTLAVFAQNHRALQFYQRAGFHLAQKRYDDEVAQWEYEMTNSPVVYATERLTVRQLTVNDRDNLARTLQDPQAMYAYAHAFSDQEVDAWLANQLRRYQDEGFGLWAVETKAGEFVGQCGLTHQNFNNETVVEIGYLLQRDHWHHGYAIEAAQGAKRYAFEQLKLPEVWSIIRDTNLASMNVAIRNGMLVRGRIVKQYYGLEMPHFGFSIHR